MVPGASAPTAQFHHKPLLGHYMKYRILPLSQGKEVWVDEEDYPRLSRFKWHAWRSALSRDYYARRNISTNGKRSLIYMHRDILGLPVGDKRKVDHVVPRQTLDNRRANLRLATSSQNLQNTRIRSDNSCGYKGVSWIKEKNKYRAEISKDGIRRYLGYFASAREAAIAYNKMATLLFGEYAFLNKIPVGE